MIKKVGNEPKVSLSSAPMGHISMSPTHIKSTDFADYIREQKLMPLFSYYWEKEGYDVMYIDIRHSGPIFVSEEEWAIVNKETVADFARCKEGFAKIRALLCLRLLQLRYSAIPGTFSPCPNKRVCAGLALDLLIRKEVKSMPSKEVLQFAQKWAHLLPSD